MDDSARKMPAQRSRIKSGFPTSCAQRLAKPEPMGVPKFCSIGRFAGLDKTP